MSYGSQAGINAIINENRVSDGLKDDRSSAIPSANWTAIIETTDGIFESAITVQYPTLTADYSGTMPNVVVRMANLHSAGLALQRQGQRALWMEDIKEWLDQIAEGKRIIPGFAEANLADSTHRGVETSMSIRALDGFGEPGVSDMSDGDENDPNE